MSHCLTLWEKGYSALEGTSGVVFLYPRTTSSTAASGNYFLGTTSSLCFYRAGAQGGSVTFWDCPLHPRRMQYHQTLLGNLPPTAWGKVPFQGVPPIKQEAYFLRRNFGLTNNFSEDTPIRKLKIIIRLGTVLNKEWGEGGWSVGER